MCTLTCLVIGINISNKHAKELALGLDTFNQCHNNNHTVNTITDCVTVSCFIRCIERCNVHVEVSKVHHSNITRLK